MDCGLTGIPRKILSNARDVVSIPLQKIINESLKSNKCPQRFKEIKTTPLHKKAKQDDINNNRLISSLDSSAVVFETILNKKLSEFCENSNLFSNHEYGFRKGKSTTE